MNLRPYCYRFFFVLLILVKSCLVVAEDQDSVKAQLVNPLSYSMAFHNSLGVIFNSLTQETTWNSNNASYEITLPFLFPFAGNFHEKIYVNTNGGISFYPWLIASNQNISSSGFVVTGTGGQHSNTPTSLYSRAAILPYWDDLNLAQGGSVSHGSFSDDGEYYVVQWNNVPRYSDNVALATLNVVLYRDGRIKFNYSNDPIRTNTYCSSGIIFFGACLFGSWITETLYRPTLGGSATIGIQQIQNGIYTNSDGTKAQNIRFSYNWDRLSVGEHQIVFTPDATEILPEFSVTKSVRVVNDPVRGTDNPKAIPGAVIEHAFVVVNNGLGASDEDSINVSDQSSVDMDFVTEGVFAQQGNTPSGVDMGPATFGSKQISIPLTGTFKGLMDLTTSEMKALVSAAAQGQADQWKPQIEVSYQITLSE